MESKNVIDNYEGNDLATYLNEVLPYCESAIFGVGYFFISGFDVIVENVKNLKELKILMSNTTDQKTAEILIQAFKRLKEAKEVLEPDKFQNNQRITEVLDTTRQNLTESIERMKQDPSEQSTIKTLLDLMSPEKNIVKVRVLTTEKLHAKAYMLKLKKGSATQIMRHDGYGIVGSSNLSIAGLKHSSELNLVTLDDMDYQHLSRWFERLWDEAEEFTEDFKKILSNSWAVNVYPPYDLYIKGMHHEMKERIGERADVLANPFGTIGPHLFDFQLQAVHQSVAWLQKYRGIIIADVVGLGKTFLTTGIAKILQMKEGLVPLIVCPPVLLEMWKEVMNTYQIHAEFISRGELSRADYKMWMDYRKRYHSLVIVDESHHFRHSDSNQYNNLKKYLDLDEDKHVILITATPLGTSMSDIFNQIRLFHRTDELAVPVGVTSLAKFEKGVEEKRYDIRDLLKQIMIRRTRKYILDTYGQKDKSSERKFLFDPKSNSKIFFPNRKLKTLTYNVQKVYDGKYLHILNLLTKENLNFARYGLGKFIKADRRNSRSVYRSLYANGPALIGLVRMLLLKRLESSIAGFKKTIRKMVVINEIFLHAVDEGIIPSGDLAQRILYETAGDVDVFDILLGKDNTDPNNVNVNQVLKQLRESKSYFPIEDFDGNELRTSILKDIESLGQVYKILESCDIANDDKFNQLVKILANHTNEKIIIFSEYSDTARYLGRRLKTAFPKSDKQIEIIDSTSGRTAEQNKIIYRFAPKANESLIAGESLEPIRVLVSTDIMSEGTNLQDAGMVINYDIHWNFVRLIQRAGRIDRIGQEREIIKIFSFLPDPRIEEDLRLHVRVKNCINDYMRVIGDDNKVLEETEKLNEEDMYAIYENNDESKLDTGGDFLSVDSLEKKLSELEKKDNEYYKFVLRIQDGIRSSSVKKIKDEKTDILVVALQAGTFKKYYKIDMDENFKEITWSELETFLVEDDRMKKPISLPVNYSKYIQKVYSVFEKEVSANRSRLQSGLGNEQLWVLETLRKLLGKDEFKKMYPQIEYLIGLYKKKISNVWLKKDLRLLKTNLKNDTISHDNVLSELTDLIQTYPQEFLKKEHDIEEVEIPKILYSKYIKIE